MDTVDESLQSCLATYEPPEYIDTEAQLKYLWSLDAQYREAEKQKKQKNKR